MRLLSFFAILQIALAPAALAAGASEGERKTLLVMNFATSGVDDGSRDAIEDLTASAMINTRAFEVITSADIAKMMEFEAKKLAVGCDDESCLAEIADALGADLVVTGRLARLGERFILKLSLMEPAEAKTVALETANVDEVEAFAAALQPIADSFAVASGGGVSAPSIGLSSVVFGGGLAAAAAGLVASVGSGIGAAIGFAVLTDPGSDGSAKNLWGTLTPIFAGAFLVSAVVVLIGAGAVTAGAVME